jgi:hypothetical protein
MIQNLKKGLFLTSVFLISAMAPVVALPQNVKLETESTLNNNGQKIVVNSKIWYGNKKIRMENEMAPVQGMPAGMNKSSMIMDSGTNTAYLMMPQNKTAIKVDSAMMNKMQGAQAGGGNLASQMLADPSQMQDQLKKNGGKMVGAEKVLNYLCDIWQINTDIPNPQTQIKENATIKVWLAHSLNIPLKVEMNSAKRGKFMTVVSKNVQTGVNIPASMFEVPKDYQVTDMKQMMNQLQGQMKKKK